MSDKFAFPSRSPSRENDPADNAFPHHRASTVEAGNERENNAIQPSPEALTSAFPGTRDDFIDDHIERCRWVARPGNGVFSSEQ
jgi:hypothetical protein